MLTLHRAAGTGTLADALALLLRTPPADPFAREVVAVPARGVERWLAQRLSTVLGAGTTDGVCANVAFPSVADLVREVTAAAAELPDAGMDPWHPARLRWTLLDVVDASLGEPWCGVLARHLGAGRGDRAGRRFETAEHLVALFLSYDEARPALVLEWAAGRDTDGAGGPLAQDLRWQAELWRRLRARVGVPGPAERLPAACERLRREPDVVDLPGRLSVFGPTRLTTVQLDVLSALAAGRDVHLWVTHPSPVMYERLRARLAAHPAPARRREDDSALHVSHPLLAGLARESRELQVRLSPYAPTDVLHDGAAPPATLLGRLQADLLADRAPTRGAGADGSLQAHACHGPARQVEVLRELLVRAFSEEPSLEARDVVVLCPDVETYAPLVRAAFGQGLPGHPGHRLRVRLADRSLRTTNPLLDVVAVLLGLAGGRVTVGQVLDLCAAAPVRRAFRFRDEDLERLRGWAVTAGARWGIGTRQRAAYGLEQVAQNTWTTALDRLLLGVVADESELAWLDRALPLDDVDSNDVDLAGRLAELVDRLASVLARLHGEQPAGAWTQVLVRALELLTDTSERDAWQRDEARRELVSSTEHAGDTPLRLADVRALLERRLAGRPTRAGFRTGDLTVCTMVPMRSVPHRVVALLGLDDEAFPRGAGGDGDDVLGDDPCLGERDGRAEDRQLLLDAVMAAQDRLLVLFTGADPVTGAERPPAVPLGELLDVVATMTGGGVVERQPLQPFDERDFRAPSPFSHDLLAYAGARAARAQHAAPALLPGPLPAGDHDDVALADLVAFLVHPTRGFLRQRLGLALPDDGEDVPAVLSAELDALARWDIGERLLAARLQGLPPERSGQAERRRGSLPPLRLGATLLAGLQEQVDALAGACLPLHEGRATAHDVSVELGDGRRLTGTVTGVHGATVAVAGYSRLAARQRLRAWAPLLALAAARPGQQWQAVTTGRGSGTRPVRRSTLTAPADPVARLRELVDLRDRGLREPLPLSTAAGADYADRRARGGTVEEAVAGAQREWTSAFGEGKDTALAYVLGPAPALALLLAQEPSPDERAWAPEPTRFGVLARRVWDPLLAAEELGSP